MGFVVGVGVGGGGGGGGICRGCNRVVEGRGGGLLVCGRGDVGRRFGGRVRKGRLVMVTDVNVDARGRVDVGVDLIGVMKDGRGMIEGACVDALGGGFVEGEDGNEEDDWREGKIKEMMRYVLLGGGKRIRGLLVLESCKMFCGEDFERVRSMCMGAAVAVEMVHAMSLVHDDLPCMDNDDWRRGKLSCHKMFGESMAVLAGDALLAKAFEVLSACIVGGEGKWNGEGRQGDFVKVLKVVGLLAESVGGKGLAGGQVMDIECEGKDVDVDMLEWIHAHKTAALLRVSCEMGAIIGGAAKEDVDNVSRFALKIGLAFQVIDDVLDVTASTKALGKTAGKDVDMDKTTYPKLLGIEGAQIKAKTLVEEAKECLRPYGDRANVLLGLSDFIIKRKK